LKPDSRRVGVSFLTPRLLDSLTSRSVDLVDRLCQLEVLARDSALAVRRQADADLVVIDRDVGMVVGLFGGFGDLVHKGDGRQERFE